MRKTPKGARELQSIIDESQDSQKREDQMSRVKSKYENIAALKKHLRSVESKKLTIAVDKLFLNARTLNDLFEEIKTLKRIDFPESGDFKSLSIVKKHIRYRQAHGWQFSLSKAKKLRLVDYNLENLQDSLF